MKNVNTLRTLVDSVIFDNKSVMIENNMTPSEYFINQAEATDWNWFFDYGEIESGITEEQIEEVKEFLKDYDYSLEN